VFGTYPGRAAKDQGKTFAPIHLEARVTYVHGQDPLQRAGFAPYGFVAAGVAEYSAPLSVSVTSTVATPPTQNVSAWYVSGIGFIGAGVGVRYAVAPRAALMFAPKFVMAFGANKPMAMVAPELAFQFGF
jgi:hypothetical protein